jgi:hypothetical protein
MPHIPPTTHSVAMSTVATQYAIVRPWEAVAELATLIMVESISLSHPLESRSSLL